MSPRASRARNAGQTVGGCGGAMGIGALDYARSQGAFTIALTCNRDALMNSRADLSITCRRAGATVGVPETDLQVAEVVSLEPIVVDAGVGEPQAHAIGADSVSTLEQDGAEALLLAHRDAVSRRTASAPPG